MMPLLLGGAALLTLTACVAPRAQGAATDAVTTDTVPTLTLDRGACHGTCPIYRLALYADGRVRFDGTRFVTPVGPDSARTTATAVQALRARFDAARFTILPGRIDMASATCGAYVADLPTVELSLRGSGGTHSVRYDQGCRDYPRVLDTLAHLVDSVSGASRWTATRGK